MLESSRLTNFHLLYRFNVQTSITINNFYCYSYIPSSQNLSKPGGQPQEAELSLLIPSEQMGGVIGKGGSVIKKIREVRTIVL